MLKKFGNISEKLVKIIENNTYIHECYNKKNCSGGLQVPDLGKAISNNHGWFKILFWNENDLRTKADKLRDFFTNNPINLILTKQIICSNPKNLKIAIFVSYFTPRIFDNVSLPYGRTTIFLNHRVSHSLMPSLSLNHIKNYNVKYLLKNNINFTTSSISL